MFLLREIPFNLKDNNTYITNVSIDGRAIKPGGLYIPIQGENNDGHHYLFQAIENGAVASFWEANKPIPSCIPNNFKLILVNSTFDALYKLSRFYLEKVRPIVIGVTGSVGKTTTKDVCFSILSKKFKTHKTLGNFNNHFGLPLTTLSMPSDTEVCILEMGMSGLGEISELSLLSTPDFAIITSIGESHLENLGTRENITKAKLEILDGLKNKELLFFDGDEELLKNQRGKSIGFENGEMKIEIIERTNKETTFKLSGETYTIPLIGDHHAKNASYGIMVAKYLGMSHAEIQKGIDSLNVSKMRMERVAGRNNSLLINDAYNASPTSMKGAISTITQMSGYSKKIIVLGDMFELGAEEKILHESVVTAITNEISHAILIGERAKWISNEARLRFPGLDVRHFNTCEEAANYAATLLSEQTVLLAKASRGMKLDKVIELLKG